MTLRCVSPYKSSLGAFAPGDTINRTPDQEGDLLRDSPGSFERAEEMPTVTEILFPVVVAIEDPPEHRAITRRSGKSEVK